MVYYCFNHIKLTTDLWWNLEHGWILIYSWAQHAGQTWTLQRDDNCNWGLLTYLGRESIMMDAKCPWQAELGCSYIDFCGFQRIFIVYLHISYVCRWNPIKYQFCTGYMFHPINHHAIYCFSPHRWMLQRGQAAELDAVDVLRDDAWNMRHWCWLVLALPPVPSL